MGVISSSGRHLCSTAGHVGSHFRGIFSKIKQTEVQCITRPKCDKQKSNNNIFGAGIQHFLISDNICEMSEHMCVHGAFRSSGEYWHWLVYSGTAVGTFNKARCLNLADAKISSDLLWDYSHQSAGGAGGGGGGRQHNTVCV